MSLEEILEEVKEIAKIYKADEVILFGSYAKGTANKYSDIDIVDLIDAFKALKIHWMRLQKQGKEIWTIPFSDGFSKEGAAKGI